MQAQGSKREWVKVENATNITTWIYLKLFELSCFDEDLAFFVVED